jgi:gallate dioxygenase
VHRRCRSGALASPGAALPTNLHIYAAMRGQSLEDFQKTRKAQMLYSVVGKDEGKKDWDKPPAGR